MKSTLHLNLKSCWYDLIEKGVKKEEYREIKPYWVRRFAIERCDDKSRRAFDELYKGNLNEEEMVDAIVQYASLMKWTHVKFTYGYTKRTMTYSVKDVVIDEGKTEWGAEPGKKYFVLKLGERVL